jgi:hypothetical protein
MQQVSLTEERAGHGATGRPVVFLPADDSAADHRRLTAKELARRIARLTSSEFLGNHSEHAPDERPLYFVPDATLDTARAERLRIAGPRDLFGGVVRFPFMATKAISHGLVSPEAARVEGWQPAFTDAVREATLNGFTAFSIADAKAATALLLASGPVRLKAPAADGGVGQSVIADVRELDQALAAADEADLSTHGLVVEEDLADVTTFSVGEVRIGESVAAYCGTQRTTLANDRSIAYGGSRLFVVRGGFAELAGTRLAPLALQAASLAHLYDAAADAHLPGLIASRRNYDVAAGTDGRGMLRVGVLEQSWRLGGASGAEIAALEAFEADPGLVAVDACCIEVYGHHPRIPEEAIVYFEGSDPEVGPLTKYALIEARYHAL